MGELVITDIRNRVTAANNTIHLFQHREMLLKIEKVDSFFPKVCLTFNLAVAFSSKQQFIAYFTGVWYKDERQ
jgi:hypothetical protein